MARCPRRPRLPCFLSTALLVFVSVFSIRAQTTTGSIEGIVVDQSGAVMSGVTIVLEQPATGLRRTAVTGERGGFRAPLLPVGVYAIACSAASFESLTVEDVRLTVGETVTLRLEMKISTVSETVTVAGTNHARDGSRTHAASTVEEASVRNLPVNGRNFIDFVLLTPGVTRDARLGDLSFAGQRGTLNSLVVDGADNNNTFAGQTLGRTGSGRAPYQFSLETVQEFKVNSNAFSAELGRAGGAVITVVTRSGTNRLQGALFEFYRDKALNATSPINEQNGLPKSPYHYNQFGGALGGPLRTDRDFFFLSYDGQRNRVSNEVFLNLPPNTPQNPATLAAIEELRPKAFSWDRRFDQDVYLGRTDHQLGSVDRLTIRYNHQDFKGQGLETAGASTAFEHTGQSLVNTRTLTATWAHVFGTTLFNEARLQYARDDSAGTANSDEPEAIVRQGGATVLIIGRNNFSPRATTIDRVQVADTLTWTRGAHKVKAGFDLQFDRIRNFFPGFFAGSYTFNSLASFFLRQPAFYQQHFESPGTSGATNRPDIREYSTFVQDEWRVRSDLTVSLGLRYDLMTIDRPSTRNPDTALAAADIDTSRLDPDTNNWGPRLGVAWTPNGRGYVVRGGAGLFYGRTPAIMVNAASNNGVNIVSLGFTGNQMPAYPQRFAEMPAAGIRPSPNILYLDRDFANPRLLHTSAAIEWALLRDLTFTATYLFVDATHLPRSIDRNLGSVVQRTYAIAGSHETSTVPFFRSEDRPFRNFQRVIALESTAESRYNGLTLELNRRFADGLQIRGAYSLGKVIDTVPDATALLPGNMGDDAKYASNPQDFEIDRAVGNSDQRHRFVASGVFATDRLTGGLDGIARVLAGGWWFSAILTTQSGQPFSARVRGDLNGDGNTINDLAPGTRRNAFRMPAIVTLDPRVARDIPLAGRARAQVMWEAFNLFNRDNINEVIAGRYILQGATLLPNDQYRHPRSTAGERIMQLALRLTF